MSDPKFIVPDEDEVTVDDDVDAHPEGSTGPSHSNPLSFNPIHIITEWKDPKSKDMRCSVAILLPSGIVERIDDIEINIIDGNTLSLIIPWPTSFMKTEKLMRIWLEGQEVERIESYHPHCESFNNVRMRYQSRESDPVNSTALFALPFEVLPVYEQHLLGWDNSAEEVLLLVLKAPPKDFRKDAGQLRMKRASEGPGGGPKGGYGTATSVVSN